MATGARPRLPVVLEELTFTEAEFWERVDVRGPDECWPWRLGLTRGYGYVRSGRRRRYRAHRIALAFHLRRDPGPVVRHSCDFGACCNWAHLLTGTQADNVADAVERGRQFPLTKHGFVGRPR